MDMRVAETFLPANDEIIGAWFPKDKRLYRYAPHADFGIANHDAGLESGSAIDDILGYDLQKHVGFFQHE